MLTSFAGQQVVSCHQSRALGYLLKDPRRRKPYGPFARCIAVVSCIRVARKLLQEVAQPADLSPLRR